jgi:hypothetical protein
LEGVDGGFFPVAIAPELKPIVLAAAIDAVDD